MTDTLGHICKSGTKSDIIKVYDSIFTSPDGTITTVIINWFQPTDNLRIEMAPTHRNPNNCDLFAIATAMAILANQNPRQMVLMKKRRGLTYTEV